MEFKIHNYLEYRKEIIEKAKEKNWKISKQEYRWKPLELCNT